MLGGGTVVVVMLGGGTLLFLPLITSELTDLIGGIDITLQGEIG